MSKFRIPRRCWTIALLIVVVGAVLTLASSWLDAPLLAWTSQHRTGFRAASREISRWGDWPTHICAALLLLALAAWRGWQSWRRIAIALLVASALAGTMSHLIKVTVARPRPSIHKAVGYEMLGKRSAYESFPSGHTVLSTAFFGVLALARPRLGIPLLAIPLLIATARVLGLAHYFSDVVGGAVIGATCAWMVSCWFGKSRRAGLIHTSA